MLDHSSSRSAAKLKRKGNSRIVFATLPNCFDTRRRMRGFALRRQAARASKHRAATRPSSAGGGERAVQVKCSAWELHALRKGARIRQPQRARKQLCEYQLVPLTPFDLPIRFSETGRRVPPESNTVVARLVTKCSEHELRWLTEPFCSIRLLPQVRPSPELTNFGAVLRYPYGRGSLTGSGPRVPLRFDRSVPVKTCIALR